MSRLKINLCVVTTLLIYFSGLQAFPISLIAVASLTTSSAEQSNAIDGHRLAKQKSNTRADKDSLRVIIQLREKPVIEHMASFSAITNIASQASQPISNRSRAKTLRSSMKSPNALFYKKQMMARQATMMINIQQVDPNFHMDFQYADLMNGFAGVLDKDAIDVVKAMPDVKQVYIDRVRYALDDASVSLIDAPAVWQSLGGESEAGRGIRVAVLDSGIRNEHPLFTDEGYIAPLANTLPTDDYCSEVPSFCNNKLIVARHANIPNGFDVVDEEHDSPLGYNGHGTHVAGIAVGNNGVIATRDGATESIGGVAPAAYLMVYKGLYSTPDDPTSSSGADSMLLSMLEAAFNDGADVINNSWGSGQGGSSENSPYLDVFANMHDAGVITVFAAGNTGPQSNTISCPGCAEDVLTVAATSTGRLFANAVSLNGGVSELQNMPGLVSGPIAITSPISGPIVFTGEINASNILGCLPYANNTIFNNAIVLIKRGECTFAEKIENAVSAGASAVVVYNSQANGEAPIPMGGLDENQSIVSLMISASQGQRLADTLLASNNSPILSIGNTIERTFATRLGDLVGEFSARGPNGDSQFLKPEIAAPGVRIFSGESLEAPGHIGQSFSFKNGTSMAAPHVAGAAALIRQLHPNWSAQQIKSALVSSAVYDGILNTDASAQADNFDIGAGRLNVKGAADVKVTFDKLYLVDKQCLLSCELILQATNNSATSVTLLVDITFDSLSVTANAAEREVVLDSGQSRRFSITINTRNLTLNTWGLGQLVLTDAGAESSRYRIPIAVKSISSSQDSLLKVTGPEDTNTGDTVEFSAFVSNIDSVGNVSFKVAVDTKLIVDESSIALTKNDDTLDVNYNVQTNEISWQGNLNASSISLNSSSRITDFLSQRGLDGYTSLSSSSFNAFPINCTASCDDSAITVTHAPITYLGRTFSAMQISSNGYITMGTGGIVPTSPVAQIMPDTNPPNTVIAPFWSDLDLLGNSQNGTTDTAGSGQMYASDVNEAFFVVEWHDVEIFNAPNVRFNFQVWFEYATGDIYYLYGDMGDHQRSQRIAVGAENMNGDFGLIHAYFSSTQVIGALPQSNSELKLNTTLGDSLSLFFSGQVSDRLDFLTINKQLLEDNNADFSIIDDLLPSKLVNEFEVVNGDDLIQNVSSTTINSPNFVNSSIILTTPPQKGILTVQSLQNANYTPSENETGIDTIVFDVIDSLNNIQGSGNLNINILPENDAPSLNVVAPNTVNANATFTVSVVGQDVDGDPLTFSINGISTERLETQAPNNDQANTLEFVVTVSDGIITVSNTIVVNVRARVPPVPPSVENQNSGGVMHLLLLLLLGLVGYRRITFCRNATLAALR